MHPEKSQKQSGKKFNKRNLFNIDPSPLEKLIKQATELIPSVLQKCHESNISLEFITLLSTISEEKLPLDNIPLLLLLEVARWYDLSNTSVMHYWPSTLLFWKIGYKIFHGKFLRFMQGLKNEGTEISSLEPGMHIPQLSHIKTVNILSVG